MLHVSCCTFVLLLFLAEAFREPLWELLLGLLWGRLLALLSYF